MMLVVGFPQAGRPLWDGPYVRSYGTAAACDLR